MTHKATLIVMTRLPAPGRVKTRLAAAIGPQTASEVHAAMLRCVVGRADGLDGITNCVLAVDQTANDGRAWLVQSGFTRGWRVLEQGCGHLGERMAWAWRAAFASGERSSSPGPPGPVIFLGSDSPDVPAAHLAAAIHALADHDAAAGPTADGGYWTLASHWRARALLDGIDWGGDRVYDQTCAAADRAGLSLAALPAWEDVDTVDDLRALRRRLASGSLPSGDIQAADDPHLARLAADLAAIGQS